MGTGKRRISTGARLAGTGKPEGGPVLELELVQVQAELALAQVAVPELELVQVAAVPGLVQVAAERALVLVAAGTASAIKASAAVHAGAVHAAAETRSAAGVVVVAEDTPLAPVAAGAAIA